MFQSIERSDRLITFPSTCVAMIQPGEQTMILKQNVHIPESKMRLYRDQVGPLSKVVRYPKPAWQSMPSANISLAVVAKMALNCSLVPSRGLQRHITTTKMHKLSRKKVFWNALNLTRFYSKSGKKEYNWHCIKFANLSFMDATRFLSSTIAAE